MNDQDLQVLDHGKRSTRVWSPQVAHVLAEHADVTASNGARIPIDGC